MVLADLEPPKRRPGKGADQDLRRPIHKDQVTQPCRDVRKKVRLIAMRALQRSDFARQRGKVRSMEIDAGVNLYAGLRTHKPQSGHRASPRNIGALTLIMLVLPLIHPLL